MFTTLLYLLAVLASGSPFEIVVDKSCPTCVVVNNTCYNSSHILDLQAAFRNRVVIHKLGILRPQNTLFYSFEPMIEDPEYYKIGFVNLDNTTTFGVINSDKLILNFGAFGIDQENGLVYLGGSDGIFVLDVDKLSPYSSRGDTVKSIFFKNHVYFVKNEDKGIIVKKGDNFGTIYDNTQIKTFIITKYDVVVFLNNFGLFVGKGDTIVKISQNSFFRGLVADLEGLVYAWWVDGIYRVVIENNLEESRIEKVADLPNMGAMTFDNDNYIIFTVRRSLFRLKPSDQGCKVKDIKKYT